jgi:hypothetical protein
MLNCGRGMNYRRATTKKAKKHRNTAEATKGACAALPQRHVIAAARLAQMPGTHTTAFVGSPNRNSWAQNAPAAHHAMEPINLAKLNWNRRLMRAF